MKTNPTPYQDVNTVLNILLTEAKDVLGKQFTGMYLYGSLSSGDFNPDSSDLDFLVVTEDTLPEKIISELETMHNRIWKTGLKWAAKLEGSYVHKDLIRRHDPEGTPCPTVNEGKFYVDRRGSDWIIQRHVIRETSVVLDGPDPKKLIDFVSQYDIRNAVMGILHEWWFPMLGNPSWLRDKEAGDRAFSVITMCRVLHALEHGTIVSKPKAIQWARTQLSDTWIKLIAKAVAVSNHKDQDVSTEETLNFIKFIKEKTL
jgi:predicted nucleotidyltransferase